MTKRVNINAKTIAKVCLFSILMLTFGPFIGQVRAPSMSPLLMHHMPGMHMEESTDSGQSSFSHEGHHQHDGMAMDHSVMEHSHHSSMGHSGMDHASWDEQCGYCTLSHNFPFIPNTVPTLPGFSPLPLAALIPWTRSAFNAETLFLLALKRAPPFSYE